MQQPGLPIRKNLQERADDNAQDVFVELMQREPLAEQAAGRESLSDRAKMFERVKRTRAVPRRMKEVGHDHIIPRAGCANETAGVGDEHF